MPSEKPTTRIRVVGAAIMRAGECLVAQRSAWMALPGKWEFPGGKVEEFESPEAALAREIQEELNVQIRVGKHLGRGSSQSGSRVVVLDVYVAELVSGTPTPREHAKLVWARADALPEFDWADADVPVIAAVQQELMKRIGC